MGVNIPPTYSSQGSADTDLLIFVKADNKPE